MASTAPARLLIDAPGARSVTYAQAEETTLRLATALRQMGLVPGDRVAVQVRKSPEAFLLYLACLRGGYVFVPLNTAYTLAELDYFLRDAEPGLFVCRPEQKAESEPLCKAAGVERLETLGIAADGSLFDFARDLKGDPACLFDGQPDTLAALLYTSGTTGRSKGAMLTHRNLASNAAALVEAWRFTGDDKVLHVLPIFHTHGLFIAGNTVLAAGAGMIFPDHSDPAHVIAEMKRATVFMGVPTHYTRLLASPALTRDATSSIRLFVSGSAPLRPETHREFEARTGHRILERYAMTETVVITSNPHDGERRPGAVGFPLPGVSVRLSDPASGAVLSGGEAVGMIEVAGPGRFVGYWRNPEKTAEDIREDGFFRTGDLGRIDEDGYLHIVGRAKDLIISGGYNVYPKEVESELDQLPGIREATVVGLPHPDFGEGVTAFVIPLPGAHPVEADLLSQLGKRLANYKQPKRILFVDEFPRNALGKIQKNVLRDTHRDLYEVRTRT
ncbi:malonyl-CoA synthase [Rhodovastum atsumiense]|uniref:Malonyl-CoA synthase n=1 Tax=Rhodovastum atsumiense TaxID=504468 RepID=A0A5M6IP70_9PROT|nr:malonyl-CoA synthase [Rhodovastum atsumiense]